MSLTSRPWDPDNLSPSARAHLERLERQAHERRQDVIAAFLGGVSMTEIARYHGVTVEAVEDLIREQLRGLR